ncbi:MAG: DNA processing protein Smf [Idiomarinaceae bacterium HL-53]|nr:MAG: DNA processing protein Smf [Idiomarinaceae bacterium HL-53]CUS47788.1 DNA processing protein [Idiomarinaceae bacterium HL-53]
MLHWNSEAITDWLQLYFAPVKLRKLIFEQWRQGKPANLAEPLAHLPKFWRQQLPMVEHIARQRAERWLNADSDSERTIITRFCEDYPEQLRAVANAPLLLFCSGKTSLLKSTQIAFVGSRNAPELALQAIYDLVPALVSEGYTITSGLAAGVDNCAHRTVLSVHGNTIAVLGCGIDQCYPSRARALWQEIQVQGLVVSEYLPGMPAKTEHFPLRNRIISGLSKGVCVIAAAMRSGSLITARLALEQNRDVFAIPYNMYESVGRGCNHLIQQGAKLVTCAADILEEWDTLEFNKNATISEVEGSPQQEILFAGLAKPEMLANVGFETTPLERVLERSGKTVAQTMNALVSLEIDGWIKAVPGGYVRVRR